MEWQRTLREIWPERQSGHGHILDGVGVEAEDTKIVNRVAIDRIRVDFFVVIEDNEAREGTSTNDVSICDDQAFPYVSMVKEWRGVLGGRGCLPFCSIYDEARGLASTGGIGIEGACLTEADGDDASYDVLDGGLPLCSIGGLCWIEDRDPVVVLLGLGHEACGLDVGGVVAGRILAIYSVTELLQGSIVGWRGGLPLGSRGRASCVHGGDGDDGGRLL